MNRNIRPDGLIRELVATDTDAHGRRELLLEVLSSLDVGQVRASSREVGTHYKWYLGSVGSSAGCRVWLHEFKWPIPPGTGYAQSIHNHRYDLDVWVLAGGYTHETFSLPIDRPFLSGADVAAGLQTSECLGSDGYYSLSHDTFHSLSGIQPGTFSLVHEHVQAKMSSLSLDRNGGAWRIHTPVDHRFLDMLSTVCNLWVNQRQS